MSRIKFSLRSIFVIVTTACVGLGLIVPFGDAIAQLFMAAVFVAAPLANLIVVAALAVSIIHKRDEQQAVAIGRVAPLIALAIIHSVQFATMKSNTWETSFAGSLVVFAGLYLTAWTGGLACEQYFHSLQPQRSEHPLTGVYRGGLEVVQQVDMNPAVANSSEPEIYEIG